MRRFIIGASLLSSEEEKQLREFLDERGSWWHWIPNMWLFASYSSELSASDIRSFIGGLNGESRVLVMEIEEDIDWATRGAPSPKGKKMTDWLNGYWAKGK